MREVNEDFFMYIKLLFIDLTNTFTPNKLNDKLIE